MLPVTNCLIHWSLHPAHDWWYTDEGGGHMVSEPHCYDDKQWHCLGLTHIPKHRGTDPHKYQTIKYTKYPKHLGLEQPEVDVDTGTPIG